MIKKSLMCVYVFVVFAVSSITMQTVSSTADALFFGVGAATLAYLFIILIKWFRTYKKLSK
jgi:hypothetical protein